MTTCDSCGKTDCSAAHKEPDESDADFNARRKLTARMCRVKHKIVVLSGKGGVGKSTVAVNLAAALVRSGHATGLLDVDIHGPSIPTMLGLEGRTPTGNDEEIYPLAVDGLKVISPGFFLRNPDEAVIWRGPMKANAIRQFLQDVAWGDLDFLVVDSPPGTGDEPLSVCQLLGQPDGAVIVTTPQKVAAVDVRKSITFCRQLNVPVIGVVENMSGFACPKCGEVTAIYGTDGGRTMATQMGVPFLGTIPIDPAIAAAGDNGQVTVNQPTGAAAERMRAILQPITAMVLKN